MPNQLQDFLTLSYAELEELNLQAKAERLGRAPMHQIQEQRLKYLTDEKRIKAVTVLFSDLEGRLHMLDYDKKFLVKSWDNLTFDGSSIRGFTAQRESDLRLAMDWSSFYWAPADVFGAGKVLVFGEVIDKDGTPYSADIRGVLKGYAQSLYEKQGYTLNAANEIEGFLFSGVDAEKNFPHTGRFDYVNTGGYYHSLPGDTLRTFIDRAAERYLPDNIYDALTNFRNAEWTTKLLGEDVKGRYADLKVASADRCPRQLGTFVKAPEVQYHHEVYNQFLWNMF